MWFLAVEIRPGAQLNEIFQFHRLVPLCAPATGPAFDQEAKLIGTKLVTAKRKAAIVVLQLTQLLLKQMA